jgi:hypothetical protein
MIFLSLGGFMKGIIALALFFCSLTFSLRADEQVVSCQKTYITPAQLHFTQSSLFAQVGDDLWVQPQSLQRDAAGFYFDSVVYSEEIPGPWQCVYKRCLTWNDEWRLVCQKCKMPRGSK